MSIWNIMVKQVVLNVTTTTNTTTAAAAAAAVKWPAHESNGWFL